jgi:DNA-binding MarR family transcriptional regulator
MAIRSKPRRRGKEWRCLERCVEFRERQMTANQMYEQMERIANLMRASVRRTGISKGLQPVQVEALHYLHRCNLISNTPMAVAEFLGLTKGTVSQTLAVLENAGLVTKTMDEKDRRVVHLTLTADGTQVLEEAIPPSSLNSALEGMANTDIQSLGVALQSLLVSLQQANGLKTFGVCSSCRFHETDGGGNGKCKLTGEGLAASEHEKICREHKPTIQ